MACNCSILGPSRAVIEKEADEIRHIDAHAFREDNNRGDHCGAAVQGGASGGLNGATKMGFKQTEASSSDTPGTPQNRSAWRIFPVAACLLVLAAAAPGQTVLVVLSSSAEWHQQAYVAFERRLEDGEYTVSPVLLADLIEDYDRYVHDQTRVVVGIGAGAAVWLHRNADDALPLAYCMVASPEDMGLTEGREMFGVGHRVAIEEQFSFIRRALPRASTLGMIYGPESAESERLRRRATEALPENWRLKAVAKEDGKSVVESIDELLRMDVDLVWTAPDAAVYDIPTIRTLLLAAMRHQTPVFGFSAEFVRAGALLGIGVNPVTQGRQAADLVLRRLDQRRNDPADCAKVSVAGPEPPEFETAVNLIVARKLQIRLPVAVVRNADHIWPERAEQEDD